MFICDHYIVRDTYFASFLVERSVDPLSGEIQVFQFLNHLYHSAREYERISAETMIHNALQAVEAHSATLAQIEATTARPSTNTTTTTTIATTFTESEL